MPSLLAVLVLLTALALLADLARPGWAAPVRRGVAVAVAPAQRALAGWDDTRVAELTRERDALAGEVARLEEQVRRDEQLRELERAGTWGEHDLLPARVVGFAPATSPVAGRTVTIDVGTREDVRPDQTVVSSDGLVGRVLRVAPTSSDVLVLGDPGVVVGVRVGEQGSLGSVSAAPGPGLPARGYGELTLTLLGDGTVEVGDEVTTLGSVDQMPYAAHLPLGTVTAVDPDRGQLGRTAVVTPHVDVDTLDLVAVVVVDGAGR